MTGINQIPTDYKKYLDQTLYGYLPNANPVFELYNQVEYDSAITTPEYVKKIQTYSDALGWTGLDGAELLADGSRPEVDGLGYSDATSTIKSYGKAFFIERKKLSSNISLVKKMVADNTVQTLERMKKQINNALITNMGSNHGQSYTASATWKTSGDPFSDLISMKNTFTKVAGREPDFLLINPDDVTYLERDSRMQSSLYVTSKPLENGNFEKRPLGLRIIKDAAVTSGTCFIGVSGMFGDLIFTENFKTFQTSEGAAGERFEIVTSWIDQYPLPYYLLKASGI